MAAHFEHGLRGGIPDGMRPLRRAVRDAEDPVCSVGNGDVRSYAGAQNSGWKRPRGSLRYRFLEETADGSAVTESRRRTTADDNAETILMNLCRGADSAALRESRRCAGRIIRPLLQTSPEEIEAYLRNEASRMWRTAATQ